MVFHTTALCLVFLNAKQRPPADDFCIARWTYLTIVWSLKNAVLKRSQVIELLKPFKTFEGWKPWHLAFTSI